MINWVVNNDKNEKINGYYDQYSMFLADIWDCAKKYININNIINIINFLSLPPDSNEILINLDAFFFILFSFLFKYYLILPNLLSSSKQTANSYFYSFYISIIPIITIFNT